MLSVIKFQLADKIRKPCAVTREHQIREGINIMTESIQNAVNKIDEEAEKADKMESKIVSQYIIDHLITDKTAELIISGTKSLSGCMKDIYDKAQKDAVGSNSVKVAMVVPDTVYGWVQEYFGVTESRRADNIVSIDLADLL